MEALAVEPLSGLTAADPDVAASATSGNTLPPSTRLPATRDADSEPDDFYGRTKEIIGFAEPGEILYNVNDVAGFRQSTCVFVLRPIQGDVPIRLLKRKREGSKYLSDLRE